MTTDLRLLSDELLKSLSKVHQTAILPTATWCNWTQRHIHTIRSHTWANTDNYPL